MKKMYFLHPVTEDFDTDLFPDPLLRGTDPMIWIRIRIRTKMSRIRNTDLETTMQPKENNKSIIFSYLAKS
jgi:hypothetical protein